MNSEKQGNMRQYYIFTIELMENMTNLSPFLSSTLLALVLAISPVSAAISDIHDCDHDCPHGESISPFEKSGTHLQETEVCCSTPGHQDFPQNFSNRIAPSQIVFEQLALYSFTGFYRRDALMPPFTSHPPPPKAIMVRVLRI